MSQSANVCERLATEPRIEALQLNGSMYGPLLEGQAASADDFQRVSCISLDDFLETVIPQSYKTRSPSLDDITERLKNGSEPALDHRGHWTKFPDSPEKSDAGEVEHFKLPEDVVSAISNAASLAVPSSLEYLNNGSRTPENLHRDNSSRPDGFFVLKERPLPSPASEAKQTIPVRWEDVAVVAEFKQRFTSSGVIEDVDKMLWSFHHILREDPRRNFVYGFTIEQTSMKLWYCDRSNIVFSEVFDIHQDSSVFLKFCLSILCASHEELGWDSTIRRVEPQDPEGDTQYIIDVRRADGTVCQFITVSVISMVGAEDILGRGTRVWEARELLADDSQASNTVVIKDYWIDDDRLREGDVHRCILDGAQDEAHRRALEAHLVTIKCHGDVYHHETIVGLKEGEPTVTLVPTSTRDFGDAIKRKNLADLLDKPRTDASEISSPVTYHDEHTPLASLPGIKTRNRIVMGQVGESLHRQKSLRTVFGALRDVCMGLLCVHATGWVHRDVSTGNIIVYKGRGYLTDFEYAKRLPKAGEAPPKAHAGRTGTPYFMPIEVQYDRYLFRPNKKRPKIANGPTDPWAAYRVPEPPLSATPSSPSSLLSKNIPPVEDTRKRKRDSNTAATVVKLDDFKVPTAISIEPPLPSLSFIFNPVHDFESLVWIGLFFLINRVVIGQPTEQSQSDLEAQRFHAREIFSGDPLPRMKLYQSLNDDDDMEIDEVIKTLHPAVREIGWEMKKIMEELRWLYLELEAQDVKTIPQSQLTLTCKDRIDGLLEGIVDMLDEWDVECEPFPVAEKIEGQILEHLSLPIAKRAKME